MGKRLAQLLFALALPAIALAQAREENMIPPEDYVPKHSYINAGFGSGTDYGGFIGTKVNALPYPWFGVFGSVGLYYNYAGFSTGVQFRLPTKKRVDYYVSGLYGVNAGLESEVYITLKNYYGFSVGGGLEFKNKNSEKTFWTIGFLVPFRDPQFQKDVDALKAQGLIVRSTDWPVTFTIGYHFRLDMGKI